MSRGPCIINKLFINNLLVYLSTEISDTKIKKILQRKDCIIGRIKLLNLNRIGQMSRSSFSSTLGFEYTSKRFLCFVETFYHRYLY